MPAIKVTQKAVEALLRKPHAKQTDYRDTITKGLVLRIGPRGAVWYYMKRIDGKLTRLRLGPWTKDFGIKAARDAVGKAEAAIASGKHPKAEQARQRADLSESRRLDESRLVETLAGEFQKKHFPPLAESTQRDYTHLLSEFVEAFNGHDVAKIKRGDLIRYLDTVKARSAAQANRAATILRQLFSFAQDRHDLTVNPALGIKAPSKIKARKRTLDRQEIRVLWRACELAGYPYGHVLRMALCTGQRIGEIGMMRRDEIEGDYWRNTQNKTDQRIDIYLAGHAETILKHCPKINAYAFTHGKTGIRSDTWGGGKSGALARHIRPMIEAAALELGADPIREHFTPHDLRRTVRTGLTGWAGVLPDTAERVLNHSITGLRKHYDFADYKPHVTEALRAWDRELDLILLGQPSTYELREQGKKDKQIDRMIAKAAKKAAGNVTPIRRAQA